MHIKDYIYEKRNENNIRTKGKELVEKYSYVRTVRGDGNCYYRSLFYSYLEMIICMGETALANLFTWYFCI